MKKLLVFIFFVFGLCGYNYFQPQFLHELFLEEGSTFYIYSNSKTDILNAESTPNGNGQILKVDKENLKSVLDKLVSVGGESVVINSNISLTQIVNKLKLKVVDVCNYNNGVIVTGYSPKLPESLYSNSDKVNIQVYISGDYVVIGYPLIMQGF